ncbi:unnamed protein product [Ascophyllum nodosum]
MSADVWTMDTAYGMTSTDALGAARVRTLDESSRIATQAAQVRPSSPFVVGRASGRSTESELEQGVYDSDEELEAIRGSVRSLRAQRVAVEQLKEKARQDEISAETLRRKLRDAEGKIKELKAQGGRDLVRRLMDEVTELRARLKSTSSAFQTREKSLADLREAVQTLEEDRQTAEARVRAQARKLEEQDRSSREQQATIRCLKEACARGEERASSAEARAEQKCAESGRKLAALSSQLREANVALDASKRSMEITLEKHTNTLEAARKERESLLFEKGRAQERINELTALSERQKSSLAESGRSVKDLERVASAARQEARLADKQISDFKAKLADSNRRRREEEASAAKQLRTMTEQVTGLKIELAEAKADAAEKERQLAEHRDQMLSFREDVTKLTAVAAQQDEMRQALFQKEETIREMRQRLELERRERGQWGRARKELLSQFCEEENKLRSTLQTVTYQEVHRPPDLATAKNNDRCKYDASDRQPPRGSGVDSALSRNGSHVGLEGGQRGVALGAGEVTSPESGDAGRQSSSASGSDREKRRERRRFVKA